MRRFNLHNSLFLFVVLCLILGSCSIAKKRKEKRVIGAWDMINVVDIDPSNTEQWIFDPDGKIYRMEIDSVGFSTTLDVGDWAIEQKINTAYLNILFGTIQSELAGLSVNWEILRLKKKTMTLTHQDGGLLTREFERAN